MTPLRSRLLQLPDEIQLKINKYLFDSLMEELSNMIIYRRLTWCSNIEFKHLKRKVYYTEIHISNESRENSWNNLGLSVNSSRTDTPNWESKPKIYVVEWNKQVRV